jgi:hypothetical protein
LLACLRAWWLATKTHSARFAHFVNAFSVVEKFSIQISVKKCGNLPHDR